MHDAAPKRWLRWWQQWRQRPTAPPAPPGATARATPAGATARTAPGGTTARIAPEGAATRTAPEGAEGPLRFGPYRVSGVLGRGASGPVYLAQAGERAVAIKTLVTDAGLPAAEQADLRERFRRQAEVLRSLDHPDIVAVLDGGELAGQPWIALSLAPRTDLSRYIRRPRLLPEPLVLRLGARIARALAHAHARGVVHRDLKPANVCIDLPSQTLTLVDFGAARVQDAMVTRTGVTLGTPAYMAPELLAGEPADARSDTYALGVMLYELLCGRLPYPATTLGELLRAVAAGTPAPLRHWRPELPESLDTLVGGLLRHAPAERPGNLSQLADELEHAADALQQSPLS